MADEDLLPIDENDDWKKALAVLAPRPQMDNRMMQAAPQATASPALVNPTGTPATPPDTALKIPGNEGLSNGNGLKTPSLSGALTAPDVSTPQPGYTPPVASNMLRTMGAQPKPQAPQDLEPHGWRKALGLGLLALSGKDAGANADEFLHGAERRDAAAKNAAGEQQLRQANIRHLDAETENIGTDKPGKTMDEQAFASLVKQGKTPLEAYTAIKQAGQDVKPDRVKTPEEQALDFLQTTANPNTGKNYTLGEAYEKIKSEGKAPSENEEERNIQSYLTSNKLPDTFENRKKALSELSKATEKPSAEAGTWSVQEDASGKPVLMNSKTGATRDTTVQKAGTADKKSAELEKQTAPVQGALGYANDYITNGRFTGAGDEALQEKFFELAKPSTGFRMSQPQMNMLQQSRSWMDSAEAKFRHATTGTWFSDEQRKQIASTMNDLAKSKMNAITNVVTGGRGGSGTKVYQGFEYTKQADGTYKKGKAVTQ